MFKRFVIYARRAGIADYVTEFKTQEEASKFMKDKARTFRGYELYCVVKYN